MKEFIINLYKNDMFPIYLGIAIIVLLIAFIAVYFLGKKDKKEIEKTQKLNLELVNKETKKEEVNNNVSLENPPKEEIPAPVKEQVTKPVKPVEVKPVAPVQTEKKIISEEKIVPEEPKIASIPAFEEKKEEVKTIENNKEVDVNNFSNIADSIEKNLKDLEELTRQNEEKKKSKEVYSSVNIPEKKSEPNLDDTEEIELPKLKEGPVLEEKKEDKLNI